MSYCVVLAQRHWSVSQTVSRSNWQSWPTCTLKHTRRTRKHTKTGMSSLLYDSSDRHEHLELVDLSCSDRLFQKYLSFLRSVLYLGINAVYPTGLFLNKWYLFYVQIWCLFFSFSVCSVKFAFIPLLLSLSITFIYLFSLFCLLEIYSCPALSVPACGVKGTVHPKKTPLTCRAIYQSR